MEGEKQVRNWLKKYEIVTKVLAVLAALVLWLFVMDKENPTREQLFKDIPVQFNGADGLLNAFNLSVIEGTDATVNVTVSDRSKNINALKKSQIKASVDLTQAGITEAGRYSVSYSIDLPESTMSYTKTPQYIEILVDQIRPKDIPVEIVVNGSAPSGYNYGDAEASQKYITIEGPDKEVASIVTARVTVPADGLTQTLKNSYEYTLINADGQEVHSSHISSSTRLVTVTLPVKMQRAVPLKVAIQGAEGMDESAAKVTLTPQLVTVTGDKSTVGAIEEITVGTIDLADARDGQEWTFTIKPPQGVRIASGQPTTVKAVLKLDGVGSKIFHVTNITMTDTSEAEEKPTVNLSTQDLAITLKGRNSALADLSASNIVAELTFDSSALEDGTHTLPVSVTVPARPDVTIDGTYTVEVEVSRA